MYGAAVAAHINQNMAARNLSAKHVASESKVPESTLSNYRTGKVDKPNEEQVLRIFAVWGDGPEVLYNIRKQVDETAAAEALLKARAKDAELIDQIAEVIKSGSMALLDQQAERMGAQQSEILQHADARVETERRRFKERAEEVLRQCNEENERIRKACDHEIQIIKDFNTQQLKMLTDFYEARLEDQRKHMEQLAAKDDKHGGELRSKNERSIEYLQSSVRNLVGSCILLAMTTLFFGAYAIFSYTTFDMADPMRGLHRGSHSIGPVVLAVSAILIAVAGSRIIILFLNRPKKKEKNGQ